MQVTMTYPPSFIEELAAALYMMFQKMDAKTSSAQDDTGQLLTVAEVASRSKRCEKTILNWIKSGKLVAINQGTYRRPSYRVRLVDWLAANTKR